MPARRTTRRPVPRDGLLVGAVPRVDAADAWATPLTLADSRSADAWCAAVFARTPRWVAALMAVRNRLVTAVGVAPVGGAGGAFPVLARSDDEVLLGVDDAHLTFRVSVRTGRDEVVVSTVVQVHNGLGRAYWAVVRWFHPLVVRGLLRSVPAPVR